MGVQCPQMMARKGRMGHDGLMWQGREVTDRWSEGHRHKGWRPVFWKVPGHLVRNPSKREDGVYS